MKLSEKITQAMLEGQVRDFSDAYQGAMEEVAIWKRRALEAETLNRKFIAGINGPMHMGEPAQPAQKAVAYLDLGVGGYMDIGTDLTDEQLASLPKGRHALGIVGTYGVDGYVSAQPGAQAQPAPSVPECPYPCGWQNLLKHAIEDGAYLARSINEDEPVTENARAVAMRMVLRLRDVLMAVNNAAPEAKP